MCRYAYELGAEPVLGAGFAKWVRRKGHRLSTNVSTYCSHDCCIACLAPALQCATDCCAGGRKVHNHNRYAGLTHKTDSG